LARIREGLIAEELNVLALVSCVPLKNLLLQFLFEVSVEVWGGVNLLDDGILLLGSDFSFEIFSV
jgi:hypothetical protein